VSRWGDLFAALSSNDDTSDTSRHIGGASVEGSRCVRSVNVPEWQEGQIDGAADGLSERNLRERAPTWSEREEERAAIIEHDGAIPRAWTEGFARLHPDPPAGDVPPRRWQRFVGDVGLFLDSPFCAIAAALGWGPYDLFGCDRDRPFARIDHAGLLWLLDGDKLVALTENTATIERRTGARQTYRRKPSTPGRVLAWELARDG
jgi:hypothetical protein